MSVVAVASIKGSPGATTVALALAATWPRGAPIVVEADPDGGVLAARLGLPAEPSVASVAVASRQALAAGDIDDHLRALPGGVGLLVGAATAEQAQAVWSTGSRLVDLLLTATSRDVVADCGRLGPRSPALALARTASLVLLVARPELDAVQHLAHRASVLRDEAASVAVVMIGDRPYHPDEVAAVLPVPVVGVLADDRLSAALLNGRAGSNRRLARSPLLRSARQVAERIQGYLDPFPEVLQEAG